MPTVDNSDLVSESDYGDIPLDQAIKESIRDLQSSLNNIEQGLLAIIDHDVIEVNEYAVVWDLGCDMQVLAKELKNIIKSFKPKGFKLGLRLGDLPDCNQ